MWRRLVINKELIATALANFNQRDAARIEQYNNDFSWDRNAGRLNFTEDRLNDVMALLSIVTQEILND